MIELNDTKVLRFRFEEIKRLSHEHRDRFDEGIDWFTTVLERKYPDMYVICKTHDPATDLVWVIMRREFPEIYYTVSDEGDTKEELLN